MDSVVRDAAQVASAQDLAQLLRALRRRHARRNRDSELSYRELAARTGWSHAAIAEYLSGRTLPPTDRLDGLLRVLGAGPAELGAMASARDRVEESRRNGQVGSGGGPPVSPRQLPAATPHFVGRAAELAALAELADRPPEAGTVVISAVEGMAGIGKTALAVCAGHRLAEQFPDGQMFVDLHGFTAGVEPVPPGQALDRLLREVGVPGERIPSGVEERAALWRSVLSGRRMLVVLDNAATEEQVRPLLPGAGGCLVLVTSRRRLIGLDVTQAVSLDMLPQRDAVTLFLRTAGRPELTTATPGVARIVELCGRLPLAIRIAGARLKHRRVWTVADLAARLGEAAGLAAIDDGPHGVDAALNLSYQHLSAAAQRLYRLLGWHPGPDIEVHAAAALAAGTLEETGRLLDGLVDDHLLEETRPGRFRFHDLVRAHAADLAAEQESEAQRGAASTRLLDHYRDLATSAMAAAYPFERQRRPANSYPDFNDRSEAERWLDAELANLLAAAQHAAPGRPEYTWDLSAALGQHLLTRGRYPDAQTLHQRALTLAHDLGDRRAQIDALNALGLVERMLGRRDQAGDHFGRALRISRDTADRIGELKALNGLGQVEAMHGHYEQAGDHHERALRIAHELGDRLSERHAHNGLGHVYTNLGRYPQAEDHTGRALRIAQDTGDRVGERQALTQLGILHRMLGRYQQASDDLGRALRIAQEIGDRIGELQALNFQGSVHRRLGRHEQAADHHERAWRIAQDIDDRPGVLYALAALGEARLLLGHHEEATELYQRALDLARDFGSDNWQFEALQGLGRLHHAAGHHELALIHHKQALQFATDLAHPDDQARAHDSLAHAHHALGHHHQAGRHWQQALDLLVGLGTDHTEQVETNVPAIRAHLADLEISG